MTVTFLKNPIMVKPQCMKLRPYEKNGFEGNKDTRHIIRKHKKYLCWSLLE